MMDRYAYSRLPPPAAGQRRGLTLIEVLVVIGLIGLLMALLLPSLAAARQQARRVGCASGLRAVGHAFNLYKSELGRYPTPGDRDPAKMFGPFWHPGDPKPGRPVTQLANIADLAEALVSASLGDPRTFYCPSSLENDRYAPKPYARTSWGGPPVPTWKTGQISYMYLVGLDYQKPDSSFPDADGQPTFNPATESPERRINRVNPATVLIGDRTVELVPPNRNIPGSDHGCEGGWFFFTSGDAQWRSWQRLTAHPTKIYLWYWPRVSRPAPTRDGSGTPP
jgi:prepilin-type N-terminal cleavage/methylation domain-containing protein